MHSENLGPVVVCAAIAMILAASPLLARAESPTHPVTSRLPALDGLRGFLALAVLLSHGALYQSYLRTGEWRPLGGFDGMLGQGGVGMFFMLTGFLFWSRLLRTDRRFDWLGFFIGRVFRIGPVYLLAAGLALIATVATTRQLNVPPPILAEQAARWLPLGALELHPVNGYDAPLLLAGVTWSLRYEWLFYAALPILALLAAVRRGHLPGACAILAICLAALLIDPAPLAGSLPSYIALFAVGMVTASLKAVGFVPRAEGTWGSVAALGLLGVVLLGPVSPYTPIAILGLGGVFFLIANGCSLFGVLHGRPARRLGAISYNVYLLQGLVLAALLRPAPLRAVALASPIWHWSLVALATLVLLLLATLSHRLIEQQGVRLGAALLAAWRRPLAAPVLAAPGLDPLERERPA